VAEPFALSPLKYDLPIALHLEAGLLSPNMFFFKNELLVLLCVEFTGFSENRLKFSIVV
jgi:hypothetical protein